MLNPKMGINFLQITDHHYSRNIPIPGGGITRIELISCSIHLDSCRYKHLFENTLRGALGSNDFVVVNEGLHHNNDINDARAGTEASMQDQSIASFATSVSELNTLTLHNGRKTKMIWRETSPQNYNSSLNGLYAGNEDHTCAHLKPNMFATHAHLSPNYRNEIVNSVLEGTDIVISHIFMPLAAFKNETYNIHNHRDCTHLNANSLFYINTNIVNLLGS